VNPGAASQPSSADEQIARPPFRDGAAGSQLERRAAVLVICAAALVLILAIAVAPAVNPTYDDAKYVGIGRNVLDGRGPLNVFGTLFLKHSPVWPVLIVVPERLAGIHPIATAHLINAIAAAAIVLLTGAFGWRARPALGALGAVTLLGQPYVRDVAQTAGIDMPSIAITLGYILLGLTAVRRRSLVLAALAGLLFGFGFLIKETILPFAPIPILAAILWGVPWPTVIRLAAALLALAALSTSWWFAMFAGYTDEVYRLGYPSSTLMPAAIGIVLFVVLGLAAEPLGRRTTTRDWAARLSSRLPVVAQRHGRPVAGWALAIVWIAILIWVFNGTGKLQGGGLFNPDQLRAYLTQAFVPVSPVFFLGAGAILAVVSIVRDPPAIGQEARALLLTAACGIPLVALVIAVGEAPRHYVGVMAILGLAGWLGWIDGAYHAIVRRDRVVLALLLLIGLIATALIGVVLMRYVSGSWIIVGALAIVLAVGAALVVAGWLGRRGRLASTGPVVLTATLLVLAAGAALFVRGAHGSGQLDVAEAAVITRTNAWIRDNAPVDSVIGIGPYLSTTTAMDLPPGYDVVMIRHFLAIGDPSAPLGLRGGAREDADWIAVDIAPGKANQFLVYEARQVTRLVEANRPEVYVYHLTRARSALSILGALTPENGFDQVAQWSYPVGSDTIETHIFRINHDRFAIDPDAMFISPEALDRLAGMLEREPDSGSRAAAALLSRIVRPSDGSLDTGLARLEGLAAQGA
jgi:4-amino-4-deoxy-L-arabinose transferase-like glycosyltransferase